MYARCEDTSVATADALCEGKKTNDLLFRIKCTLTVGIYALLLGAKGCLVESFQEV
jgi:hypothetical protein